MVAQMLKSACEDKEPEPLFVELDTFTSVIHKQDINLEQFAEFLEERCWDNAHEAVEKSNFDDLVRPSVFRIANGDNVWDGREATKADKGMYI